MWKRVPIFMASKWHLPRCKKGIENIQVKTNKAEFKRKQNRRREREKSGDTDEQQNQN